MRRLSLTFVVFCASFAPGEDVWPQFRGPLGAAANPDARIPRKWDETTIRWKFALPGGGISSPVVWKEDVYVTVAQPNEGTRLLLAVDAATGKEKWRLSFPLKVHKKHSKNSFATATPATDGERVYIVFSDPDRHVAVAADRSGKLLWEKNLGTFAGEHSSGASPVAIGGRVYYANDQDGPSSLLCLDGKTGDTIWQKSRPAKLTAYSTPLLLPAAKQIVLNSALGLTGFDLETGEEKWRCHVFEKRAVGSPTLAAGLVVSTSGQGSAGHKMIAVDPSATSDAPATWTLSKEIPYCPTSLAVGDLLFFVTDIGLAKCLEAKTGRDVRARRLAGKFSASLVLAGDAMLAIAEDGTAHWLTPDRNLKELGKTKLADYVLSTPAVCDRRLYVRGEKFLWCIGEP